MGANLGKTTGWIHRKHLQNFGVSVRSGVTYDKIDDSGDLHITTADRGSEIISCDNIIVCAGQEPLHELEEPLKDAGIKCFRIGGAKEAGELDANRAIDQGTRLALVIEEAGPEDSFDRSIGVGAKVFQKIVS